jgi:hypothetical protein
VGLGREDAPGELEGLALDLASAAGDQGVQESRFALVGEAVGSLIGVLGEDGEVVVTAGQVGEPVRPAGESLHRLRRGGSEDLGRMPEGLGALA